MISSASGRKTQHATSKTRPGDNRSPYTLFKYFNRPSSSWIKHSANLRLQTQRRISLLRGRIQNMHRECAIGQVAKADKHILADVIGPGPQTLSDMQDKVIGAIKAAPN